MHDPGAALVVSLVQRLLVAYRRDADPCATIVRLHEKRVADAITDFAKIEQLGILAQCRLQVRRLDVGLGRHQPRIRNGKAKTHHRGVRGVLFH